MLGSKQDLATVKGHSQSQEIEHSHFHLKTRGGTSVKQIYRHFLKYRLATSGKGQG